MQIDRSSQQPSGRDQVGRADLLDRDFDNNRRILIVDDNRAIHEDFRKILGQKGAGSSEIDDHELALFGTVDAPIRTSGFELDSAYQGEEALKPVQMALRANRPYAVAFIDVRMPPGWDGVETSARLLREDPNLQIVLCTAYSDYSWEEMVKKIGETDRLLILKKPFDTLEVRQLAHSLHRKWVLSRQVSYKLEELEEMIHSRTNELQSANDKLRHEMAERERIETELRLAQKLEAVGQLAAGIAHEMNTPMQYVGDNVHFLRTAFDDYLGLIKKYEQACSILSQVPGHETFLEEIKQAEETADLAYLKDHLPQSFDRTFEGIERVSTIVQAMKEFSHPDQREKTRIDINKGLANTLTVARNEYKYVAEVETELGDLPSVLCHGGEINQVFPNLIVNAAHAIGDVVKDTQEKGKIHVRTEVENENTALITIRDSGAGIPEEIRQRVFDPFFTTKEVGRGTGQGLAIARSAIVDKHGGSLTLESEVGRGTTFFVRLPIDGNNNTNEENGT